MGLTFKISYSTNHQQSRVVTNNKPIIVTTMIIKNQINVVIINVTNNQINKWILNYLRSKPRDAERGRQVSLEVLHHLLVLGLRTDLNVGTVEDVEEGVLADGLLVPGTLTLGTFGLRSFPVRWFLVLGMTYTSTHYCYN